MTRPKLTLPCSRFKVWRQNSFGLVVPGQAIDLTLYQNQTELRVSVFPVPLQVFDHRDRFFHQMIQMLGQVLVQEFPFQNLQNLVSRHETNLCNSVGIYQSCSNLEGRRPFLPAYVFSPRHLHCSASAKLAHFFSKAKQIKRDLFLVRACAPR